MEQQHQHTHKWYTFGCKDATLLMTKSSFSSLSFSEKILLTFHTLICKYCRRFKSQTQIIGRFFKSNSEESTFQLPLEKKEALNQIITKNLN